MANENYRNLELESDIDKCESGSKIDLSFRQLIDRDMDIVVQQAIIEKQCRVLLLNDNCITAEGATTIAKALWKNTTLEELNLWNNQVSDLGVESLSRALMNNSFLRSLGLGQNRISYVGAQHLAEMLKSNSTIVRLWLFHNEIDDQGVKALTDVLANHNQTLEWLDLRLNKSVTDSSFDSLSHMLESNRSLNKFWMEYCNLSPPIKAKLRLIGQAKDNFDIGA